MAFIANIFLQPARNTDDISVEISVPNFAYSSLRISYAFHCEDFYNTQNISMVLHGELLYQIPHKSVK
jgi:hypothetical protein